MQHPDGACREQGSQRGGGVRVIERPVRLRYMWNEEKEYGVGDRLEQTCSGAYCMGCCGPLETWDQLSAISARVSMLVSFARA
jgi:hypothetical protein